MTDPLILRQEIATRAATLFNALDSEDAIFKGFNKFHKGKIPANSVYVIPAEDGDTWFARGDGGSFADIQMLLSAVIIIRLGDWDKAQERMERLVYTLMTDLHLANLTNGAPAVAMEASHVGMVGDDAGLVACAVSLKPQSI